MDQSWGKPQPASAQTVILSLSGLRGLDRALASEPLGIWKAYLEWNVLNASAAFLPARFAEARYDFYGRALFGRKQMSGGARRCIYAINRDLGEIAARAFIDRTITPQTQQAAVRLTEALRRAFAEEIDDLDWMSPRTKTYAKEKLAAMVARVASPDHGGHRFESDSAYQCEQMTPLPTGAAFSFCSVFRR